MYNDFTEMPVWKDAMEFAEAVFTLTEPLPRKEDYGLTSQIRRSSLSISSNIAEAFGRFHTAEKVNLYFYARASAQEAKSQLIYGITVGYFDQQLTEEKIKQAGFII
jgi:four helix bundle protein